MPQPILCGDKEDHGHLGPARGPGCGVATSHGVCGVPGSLILALGSPESFPAKGDPRVERIQCPLCKKCPAWNRDPPSSRLGRDTAGPRGRGGAGGSHAAWPPVSRVREAERGAWVGRVSLPVWLTCSSPTRFRRPGVRQSKRRNAMSHRVVHVRGRNKSCAAISRFPFRIESLFRASARTVV